MIEPVTAADCRLLLSLLKFAIVDPLQRERVEAWLEAKKAALEWSAPSPSDRIVGFGEVYREWVADNVAGAGR